MSNPTCKRALVTGATGYIGSNLVRRLVSEGWDVHIVTRINSDLQLLDSSLNSLTVHRHDGTSKDLVNIVANASPGIVFHLASLYLAHHTIENIETLISCNLLFSTQLLEAMAANDVRYLINTGTSWQHYENEDYNPVNLYAATKQAFEDILTYYSKAHSLQSITLVLFDTYGPKDPRSKLIPLLLKTALCRQPLSMSPGEQLIDLVYIEDVIQAYLIATRAIEVQVASHMRYGVSSSNPIRLIDLVSLFERVTHTALPITFGARPYRFREAMIPWSRYQSLPGWEPQVSLDGGLRTIYEAGLMSSQPTSIRPLD